MYRNTQITKISEVGEKLNLFVNYIFLVHTIVIHCTIIRFYTTVSNIFK